MGWEMEINSIDPHAMFLHIVELITCSLTRSPIIEVQHISISPMWLTIVFKYIPHTTILA
jgi:hypothetical protein